MNKLKLSNCKFLLSIFCAVLLAFRGSANAATINILSTTAPIPGPNDQYQTNFVVLAQSPPPNGTGPGQFNYYLDFGLAPGQTFATGNNPNGYILNTLALYDADNTGNSLGAQTFTLAIYSVTNSTNAVPLVTYVSQTIQMVDFNWFQWTNLGAILQPNTQYAFAFWRNGSGWMNLGNNNASYAGGQVAEVPKTGGPMTFSSSSPWNADFDIGLTAITAITVGQTTFPAGSVAISGSTVTANAAVSGPTPYFYQWQTDGGGGGALTNIPAATSASLAINTTGFSDGYYQYALAASNNNSSAKGQVGVLQIQHPIGIAGVIAVKFGFTNGYATLDAPLPADNTGVPTGQIVPPSYAPLTTVGNWNNLWADPNGSGSAAAAINQTWPIGHDTTGATLSGVTLTPSGFNDGWYSGGTGCAAGRLLFDFWKINNGGANPQHNSYGHLYGTLTFNNLSSSKYDVIVFVNNNNGNYWGNMQANDVVAQNSDFVDDTTFGFNGASGDPCSLATPLHTYAAYNGGNSANSCNYIKMSNVATSGGSIAISVVSFGGGDMGVSGVELIPSPDITLTKDILPSYVETTVGKQVIFTAAFSDSPAVDVKWLKISDGTTNTINTGVSSADSGGVVTSTLTLNNVQLSDEAIYLAQAVNVANSSDYTSSSQSLLVVTNTLASVNNVLMYNDAQVGANFYPQWSINQNADLVYNFVNDPTGSGSPGTFTALGSFGADGSSVDPSVLVDGVLANSPSSMLCGGPGNGTNVTFFLNTNAAALGFELTNIIVYGGWPDGGRRDQEYQVLYSTVSAPGQFTSLLTTHYLPDDPSGAPIATRTTLIPAVGVLAHNVYAVQINWALTPQYLNGYASYSEIEMGGTNSTIVVPVLPSINLIQNVGGSLIVTGSGGSPNGSYTWLGTTNLTPPIIWTTNSVGALDAMGAFSNAIPISPSQRASFFRLRMP